LTVTLLHPTVGFSWTDFSVHPSTVVGIAALGALYAWRTRAARGTGGAPEAHPRPSAAQKLAFASGLAVLFLTLNGPIHDLSDSYLFSAHMVQHLLLTMLVTPLLIAGTPGWMLRPALRYPVVAAVARRITTGPAAFVIFNLTLVAWHLPPLYNAALLHHPVHIVQHLCFLVASTLMWWPLMSPLPELPRLSYPQQMLYAFLMTLPMTAVSILITYADTPLYPFYASAPRLWGLSPHDDQLLGGLIMWIPGGLIFLGVLTVVFFKWAASGEDDVASAQVVERPA
jgi:putative membrane protein